MYTYILRETTYHPCLRFLRRCLTNSELQGNYQLCVVVEHKNQFTTFFNYYGAMIILLPICRVSGPLKYRLAFIYLFTYTTYVTRSVVLLLKQIVYPLVSFFTRFVCVCVYAGASVLAVVSSLVSKSAVKLIYMYIYTHTYICVLLRNCALVKKDARITV